ISFMLYAFIVAKGVRSASDFWSEAARTAGTTAWVLELLERQPQLPTSGGQRPSESQGQIILDDVHFAYAGRPDVSALAGVSLEIEPGETVALVGRSGSGKSTIVNLLLRFYDPTGGRVLLDGRDIRELDSEWLRSQIGIVMQEPVLFSRTVAENIRYGHADGADGMTMAAELARATEFIERLPQRYDTEIGERGVQISGGQRQRLAIARAGAAAADPYSRRSDERARRGKRSACSGRNARTALQPNDAHCGASFVHGGPRRSGRGH
ncbi:MAG: ATP-binding cassette domain-containing protein, partial [Chthoniobacterales bacterium]